MRFHRPPGLLPLPMLQQGDRSNSSRHCLNLPGRDELVLVTTWLLAALRHGGPYPLLVIAGEQGSVKTVLSKMLRALVDPNVAPVRTLPREERDLFIAANNGHVLAFDNLSALAPWLSDALCRLASGGSFAIRQLYTDQDEVLFDAARPIILNGIENVVSRPDLADRALFLTLPWLSEARRRPEQKLWQQFELVCPRLLGALLDAVSHGLRALPQVRLDRLPRMADFALWARACETALWPTGTFARAYAANRRAAIDDAIDADPVAACVRDLMAERSSWTGSAADLLRAGTDRMDGISRASTGWPNNPRALAGRLRCAQTFLRALGIKVAFTREGRSGSRVIRIHNMFANTGSSERRERPPSQPPDGEPDNTYRPDLAGSCPIGQASVTARDDADGADADAAFRFGQWG